MTVINLHQLPAMNNVMNKRLESVAIRRLEILEKIAAQRLELVALSQDFQRPLGVVDTGLKGINFIRNHPTLLAGLAGGFLALRRTGIIGWMHKGWSLLYLSPVILSAGSKILSAVTRSSRHNKNTEDSAITN
jgi:hypothetical protein